MSKLIHSDTLNVEVDTFRLRRWAKENENWQAVGGSHHHQQRKKKQQQLTHSSDVTNDTPTI